jgi:DNA-binding HxlR family transcriptional regulator
MKKMTRRPEPSWIRISNEERIDYCGVRAFMEILGGKWKFQLLSLMFPGPVRYSDLLKAVPDASEKMIFTSLRELEDNKLIERRYSGDGPRKVEYALTEHGRGLKPLLLAVEHWGKEHIAAHPESVYFPAPTRQPW